MSINYYFNEDGLNSFISSIENKPANQNFTPKMVFTVKAQDFQNIKQNSSAINVNVCIKEEQSEDGQLIFILKNKLNNTEKRYSYQSEVDSEKQLQNIKAPVIDNVYKIKENGAYGVWNGNAWEFFKIINNFKEDLFAEQVSSISPQVLQKVISNVNTIAVTNIEELKSAINNEEEEVVVLLSNDLDLNETIIVPLNKKVILNLNNHSMTASTMTFQVNGGELEVQKGSITSNANDAITVHNGGKVIVDNANITSVRRNGISAKESTIIMNSGTVTSQEAGLLGLKDSNIIINGGVITALDNGAVMGNGSAAGTANDGTNMNVIMRGGQLIGHIQSSGYMACAVYVPNSGSFTMEGGEIISDGCGICMRGGKVDLKNGSILASGEAGATGKVGDSRVVVGSYAITYDANSKYPAVDSLELVIGKDMILQGTDGDIQTLIEEGRTANITDNRS